MTKTTRCINCRFFVKGKAASEQNKTSIGLCKRMAPVFNMNMRYGVYPFVRGKEDWCGEFDRIIETPENV